MGNLNFPVDGSDLVDGLDLRAEASMHTEHLPVDNGSDGQVIEDLGAVLPGIGVPVFSVDLIVEAVNGGNLAGLVVASQQGDPVGVFDLQAQQVLESLNGVEAPVNKIANEDVAGLVDLSA